MQVKFATIVKQVSKDERVGRSLHGITFSVCEPFPGHAAVIPEGHFHIYVLMEATVQDSGTKHDLSCLLIGEEGESIIEVGQLDMPVKLKEGQLKGFGEFTVPLFEFSLPRVGEYVWKIKIDGEIQYEFSFFLDPFPNPFGN